MIHINKKSKCFSALYIFKTNNHYFLSKSDSPIFFVTLYYSLLRLIIMVPLSINKTPKPHFNVIVFALYTVKHTAWVRKDKMVVKVAPLSWYELNWNFNMNWLLSRNRTIPIAIICSWFYPLKKKEPIMVEENPAIPEIMGCKRFK